MLAILIGLLGLVAVVAGVALIYPPLAFIVGGIALIRLAMLIPGG